VELHPQVGKLPRFPAMRGVVPVLSSASAVGMREALIKQAFTEARVRRSSRFSGAVVPNAEFISPCANEDFFFETQNVCYRGGPVLHEPTIHLIFWQGPLNGKGEPANPNVELFTALYEEEVERYFADIAADSHRQTNVFAVDPQYGEGEGEGAPGEYAFSFNESSDVSIRNDAPLSGGTECTDSTPVSKGPCLLDTDIQNEAKIVATTSEKGLGDIYVVLTPKGMGGCFEAESGECAYRQYCAYHGDFGGNGRYPQSNQTLYVDLPYLGGVEGCDSGVHPANPSGDNGADAVIDTASHEINETVTDPLGSQCETNAKSSAECEPNSWTDAIGQELADKCLPPESTVAGIYGKPLVEGLGVLSYNQLIDDHKYFTQRVWSNEAGLGEGACVQRRIEAAFSLSASPQATVPTTLDGSASGATGDPAVYWVWNFGGGEQIGTASPTVSHTFPQPGLYAVGLTAYDAYGNSQAGIGVFEVGAAPAPPAPPTPALPITIKEAIVPGHYTAAQVAAALGLPANGKKLSGFGPFALGHAQCPPACVVNLQLYAKETKVVKKHRASKWVPIGNVRVTVSANNTATLTLTPSAKGKALLHKVHSIAGKLVATVEGQEGGSWQITRTLTLVSGGKAARR
jgi:hypothetical protein